MTRGFKIIIIDPTTYTNWDDNSRSEDMVERVVHNSNTLAWWSIIRKIWFRRLFGTNTILIVSKTSISNATTTRRLIISIWITISCSSIWIFLWIHHWKLIKIISTKITGRAITVSKVVIWSIIYLSEIRPWFYIQNLQVLINTVIIWSMIIMPTRIIIIVRKCS